MVDFNKSIVMNLRIPEESKPEKVVLDLTPEKVGAAVERLKDVLCKHTEYNKSRFPSNPRLTMTPDLIKLMRDVCPFDAEVELIDLTSEGRVAFEWRGSGPCKYFVSIQDCDHIFNLSGDVVARAMNHAREEFADMLADDNAKPANPDKHPSHQPSTDLVHFDTPLGLFECATWNSNTNRAPISINGFSSLLECVKECLFWEKKDGVRAAVRERHEGAHGAYWKTIITPKPGDDPEKLVAKYLGTKEWSRSVSGADFGENKAVTALYRNQLDSLGPTVPSGKKVTLHEMPIADLREQYNNLLQPMPIPKNVSDTVVFRRPFPLSFDPAKEGSEETYVAQGPFPQADPNSPRSKSLQGCVEARKATATEVKIEADRLEMRERHKEALMERVRELPGFRSVSEYFRATPMSRDEVGSIEAPLSRFRVLLRGDPCEIVLVPDIY